MLINFFVGNLFTLHVFDFSGFLALHPDLIVDNLSELSDSEIENEVLTSPGKC